jgi:hypothetical protein
MEGCTGVSQEFQEELRNRDLQDDGTETCARCGARYLRGALVPHIITIEEYMASLDPWEKLAYRLLS